MRVVAAVVAVAAAVSLVAAYVALGGGAYEPLRAADPCKPRPLRPVEGVERALEQVALSGLDGAACRLRVTREELALALATPAGRDAFVERHGITGEGLERVLRAGLRRAVSDAERADLVDGPLAALLRQAVERLPIDALLDAVRGGVDLVDRLREALPQGLTTKPKP